MKKIVIYVDSLKRDGAERVSVNLARYMNEQGIDCTLLTDWTAENEYEVPEGVKRISLDCKGNKYLNYLRNIRKMKKVLKTINPDTFLIMDLAACLLGIPASRGLKMNVVVSERNAPTHFPGKKIVAKVSRKLMSKADGFVFQTEDAKLFYKKITKGRGIIIPNPLFLDNIPDRFEGVRKKEIVTAGRLNPQKNQMLLIEAFSKIHNSIPDYNLVIYGEGQLKDDLVKKCQELGVDKKVFFPGNKVDLLDRIKDASLFVMSSDFEGMPNALLEAMALGLPCISTDCPCGGPRFVIKNEVNGILVPVNDVDSLAAAIERVICDKELAQKLGDNAINIRDELDSKKICEKWKKYLEEIEEA